MVSTESINYLKKIIFSPNVMFQFFMAYDFNFQQEKNKIHRSPFLPWFDIMNLGLTWTCCM
jgi:hypothetical protein